ncbi:phospholipid-transporting ATPase IF-like isoform X2 [Oratosquilla oratoria]|uniref:phospholipid-transporting ATPase IF-like isoform X2 n=1 Tax=Oratosquilla oratoria TaxID=337810 RepID=UPI003F765952
MAKDGRKNLFCCCGKKGVGTATCSRLVFLNRALPPEPSPFIVLPKYRNNKIKTAKYTLLNFFPRNLFEQFRRIANFYFLCIAIVVFSIDSPVAPITSTLPLLFVVFVTMIKQGYEDWRRHREDGKVNRAKVTVVRNGLHEECRSQDVHVGDIVLVKANEPFPCDLLLLASSDPAGACHVTTANLDGETNLKTFRCPPETQHLTSPEELWHLRAIVECQLPHANLYDFKGRLDLYVGNARPIHTPLATENLLLRGARLKNTPFVYGCAIYTGEDTKMALNTKITNNKFSCVEKSMNYFLLFFLGLLMIEVLACTLIKYLLYGYETMKNMKYLGPAEEVVTPKHVIRDGFSFLVIFNYVIPISLYVTLEIQKFLGTLFLQWDDELQCPSTGERAKCNTSDLNEELGQVEYLFTDKTGTLTENMMNFRECSVKGVKYMDGSGHLCRLDEETQTHSRVPEELPEDLETFLVTLGLCHTVEVAPSGEDEPDKDTVERKAQNFEYHASSPDEKALVEACARYGVVFLGFEDNCLHLSVRGQPRIYRRHQVLEFDSDRKRMSVVVQEKAEDSFWVLTKGAESSVLSRCSSTDNHLVRLTEKHIDDYALLGLRTLAVARRHLTRDEYNALANDYNSAMQEIDGREQAVRTVVDRFESDLELLGATGVEDKLQDGVQETLEALRVAGIKVWILTGDKVETAVNIAYACGHFKRFMKILRVTRCKDAETASRALSDCWTQMKDEDVTYGLVVDGLSLALLLENDKNALHEVALRCTAVVCCRMSPKQKAETVQLVKHAAPWPITAAIGDGANDVSMIQEAHVGLGLMGKEGRQAVRCADFAFARFRFLRRILLVHGHWYYVRVATLVLYSFYKNFVFITPNIFYATMSAFSTQSVYESFSLTFFNITHTSLPIIFYGLFEQPLPAAFLLQRPYLYHRITGNAGLSWTAFAKWIILGLWHTSVMYYGLVFVWGENIALLPEGQTGGLYLFGSSLVSLCVVIVNLKIVLVTHYQTVLTFGIIVLTLLGYMLFSLIYNGVIIDFMDNYGTFWAYYRTWECPALIFGGILLTVLSLLPDILLMVFENARDETANEILRARKDKKKIPSIKVLAYDNLAYEGDSSSLWEYTRKDSVKREETIPNGHGGVPEADEEKSRATAHISTFSEINIASRQQSQGREDLKQRSENSDLVRSTSQRGSKRASRSGDQVINAGYLMSSLQYANLNHGLPRHLDEVDLSVTQESANMITNNLKLNQNPEDLFRRSQNMSSEGQ